MVSIQELGATYAKMAKLGEAIFPFVCVPHQLGHVGVGVVAWKNLTFHYYSAKTTIVTPETVELRSVGGDVYPGRLLEIKQLLSAPELLEIRWCDLTGSVQERIWDLIGGEDSPLALALETKTLFVFDPAKWKEECNGS